MDPDGTVYIADTGNNLVRRVGIDGTITTFAGGGDPADEIGDGGPATSARLSRPAGVAVAPDGDIVIADRGNDRVREVRTSGAIVTLAGGGTDTEEGAAARQAPLRSPAAVAVMPDGTTLVSERDASVVTQVRSLFEGFSPDDILIPSTDGAEVFQFSGDGRHLSTRDALTGAVLNLFGYDAAGRLTSITSTGGRVTTIERDPSGTPTAIVAAGGQRTALDVDGAGYLAEVENGAGEALTLDYDAGGLLTSMVDPEGGISSFDYDGLGRLTRDEDPSGDAKTITRQNLPNGYEVHLSSDLGSEIVYRIEGLPGGASRRTTIDRSGETTVSTVRSDASVETRTGDGQVMEATFGPDPRFGLQAPVLERLTETTPAGRERVTVESRDVVLADPGNPLSLVSLTDATSVNGATSTATYTASTRTLTRTSPEGRESRTVFDTSGRLISVRAAAGLDPMTTTFDSEGRIEEIAQGVQSWQYTYDSRDRIVTRTDANGDRSPTPTTTPTGSRAS